jgi:hypothetical protein
MTGFGGNFLGHLSGRRIYRTGSWERTQTIEFGNLRLEEPFQTAGLGA